MIKNLRLNGHNEASSNGHNEESSTAARSDETLTSALNSSTTRVVISLVTFNSDNSDI